MRICIGRILPFIALALSGCQSSTPATSQEMRTTQRAVVTSVGNGGSTSVFIPTSDTATPAIYCSAGAEVCPECKSAAIKYFQTGVLDPKCSRTGAVRTVVTPNPVTLGHN